MASERTRRHRRRDRDEGHVRASGTLSGGSRGLPALGTRADESLLPQGSGAPGVITGRPVDTGARPRLSSATVRPPGRFLSLTFTPTHFAVYSCGMF